MSSCFIVYIKIKIIFLFSRSDDTARSEIESRGEPEGGEETPPPVNCKISQLCRTPEKSNFFSLLFFYFKSF